ncbi:MAG TPA: HEAT repeat domain-containing protein [Gemmatimonadales bacterium]
MTGYEVGLMVALAALAASLLAALLLAHWWHGRLEARAARIRQSLLPMLASHAEPDPRPSAPVWLDGLSRRDGRMALVACLEALPSLDPTAAKRVRTVLHRSQLARRELARLRHRSAAVRSEACRVAGRLGGDGTVPLLVERLRDDDYGVRREAIRALGELRAAETVPEIAAAIEGMADWSNLLLLMALIRIGPDAAPAIGALLGDPGARSPAMIKALLQVSSRLGVVADAATVRALASHADPEIRVESVRVLGAIAPDAESLRVCLAAMDDPEWPVRAIAASSLGRRGDARALPRLARAMGEPAYWVRHHVADAMASLGAAGAGALQAALLDDNPFVRDMAAQALFMRAPADGEAA